MSGSENLPRFGIFGGRVSPSSLFHIEWIERQAIFLEIGNWERREGGEEVWMDGRIK